MISVPTPARVGRPPRTFVDRAKALAWIKTAYAEAACSSPSGLEAELKRRKNGQLRHFPTKSVFHKYLRGETGPGSETVHEMGALLPKAHAVYSHPIWALAAADGLNSGELHRFVLALPAELAENWTTGNIASSPFWRKPGITTAQVLAQLQHYGGLDQGAIVLALLHESVLRQDEEAHFAAWTAWAQVGMVLRKDNRLSVLHPSFFAAVARRAQTISYRSAPVRQRHRAALGAAKKMAKQVEYQRELAYSAESQRIEPISVFDLTFLWSLFSIGQPKGGENVEES